MSDDIQERGFEPDDVGDVELLLRELDLADLELSAPPLDVWAGIDKEIRGETVIALPTPARHAGRHRLLLLAAAAVVALVATAVVDVAKRHDPEEVVATAVLTHDQATFDPRGADARATARLLERDGHYEIQLAQADLPTVPDDDLELWLIEPDAQGKPKDIAPVSLIS